MNRLTLSLAVAGLAAAGFAAYWVQNRPPAPTVAAGANTPGAPPAGAPGRPGPAGPGGAAAGPVLVEVGKVEVMRLADDAQAVGSLRSRQGVMLRPEVAGRVQRIDFKDGQRVARGQLLVQLDDSLQRAEMAQAQAQLGLAQANFNRNRDLVAQNFVSQRALDESGASLEVVRAQLALAQARLDRMRVLAPFDGVAGLRSVNIGDYVKDGADLVNVEDTSAVYVDYRLPERFLERLRPGQKVEVRFDALPGRAFTASVDAIDPLLDANGRSVAVRARIDNAANTLRPGLFARIRTEFSVREAALVVPEEALVPQGDKQFLVKVIEGPKGPTAQRIEARLGLRRAGKVEILEGVAAGDTVVTAGHGRLMRGEGQALKVVDLARPAARPAAGAGPAASQAPAAGPGPAGSAPRSGANGAAV
jgi:membrane fusion protein (multidrug efflux system)